MPDSKKKTVLVCGDLVWDTHVARLPRAGHNYSDPHPYTQLMNGYGGAWYLKELIDQYVKATNKWISLLPRVDDEPVLSTIEADVISPNVVSHEKIESADCPPGIATGFSVWSWHEGTKRKAAVKSVTRNPVDGTIQLTYKWPDGEPQAGAWRISEFLGCREANWNCKAAFPEACGLPGEPALLVIDDLGLGFASHPECWPTCLLGEGSAPAQILVKGLPKQGSALRNLLLAKSTWAERVTLVVSVTSLREQGAKLTHGMSWDLLREELDVVFALGGAGWPFRKCKRVVVTFGRSGAAVFSREPMAPEEVDLADVIRLERLVYDPDHLEDTWSARYPGVTFGTGSIVAAAMAVHCLQDVPPSTHLTVARALEVARANHRYGGGHNSKEIDLDVRKSNIVTDTGSAKFRSSLRSSYPRHLLPKPVLATLPDSPSLLTDVISSGDLFLRLTAEDIVVRGAKTALAAVPNLEVAKYFTVDREEIENLNAVRNLITSYVESKDTKPLSIAVFGAPGSGKSFAIKQLAEEIFGEQKATLEFNLSQFKDESDLYEAFHEVRDKSVKGQVPLVFWDEFDSNSLKWLKEFLAPMQDSEFVANGRKHPFAKCIFVFAGGTSTRFEEFDCSRQKDNSNAAKRATTVFKGLKGPDFVSRLRGFVNIKGPNPVVIGKDEVAIIRRALLLRSMIERIHPTAIDPNDHLDIDPRLLSAFLGVKEYNHGARSMEAIVSLSRLGQGSCYGPSDLPPKEVIRLHVSDDFRKLLEEESSFRLDHSQIEVLAERIYNAWVEEKERQRMVGPIAAMAAEQPKPFKDVSEDEKESNRLPARLTMARMGGRGYQVVVADSHDGPSLEKLHPSDVIALAHSEHRRWVRQKLVQGFAYSKSTIRAYLLHVDMCEFDDVRIMDQKLDFGIIETVTEYLKEIGYALTKN